MSQLIKKYKFYCFFFFCLLLLSLCGLNTDFSLFIKRAIINSFFLITVFPILAYIYINKKLFNLKYFLLFYIPQILFYFFVNDIYISVDSNQYLETLQKSLEGYLYTNPIRSPFYGTFLAVIYAITKNIALVPIVQGLLNALALTYLFQYFKNRFKLNHLILYISIVVVSINIQRLVYNTYLLTEGITPTILALFTITTVETVFLNYTKKSTRSSNLVWIFYFSSVLFLTKSVNVYLFLFPIFFFIYEFLLYKKIALSHLISCFPVLLIILWSTINYVNFGTPKIAGFSGYSIYGVIGYYTNLESSNNQEYKDIIREPLTNLRIKLGSDANKLAIIENFMWGKQSPLTILENKIHDPFILDLVTQKLSFEIILNNPKVFIKHFLEEIKAFYFQKLTYVAYATTINPLNKTIFNDKLTIDKLNYQFLSESSRQLTIKKLFLNKKLSSIEDISQIILFVSQYRYVSFISLFLTLIFIVDLLIKIINKKKLPIETFTNLMFLSIIIFQGILTVPFVMGLERYFYPVQLIEIVFITVFCSGLIKKLKKQ